MKVFPVFIHVSFLISMKDDFHEEPKKKKKRKEKRLT